MNTLNQKLVAFLLVLILFASSCGGGNSEPRKFNELGYFKDSNKARVYTVSYTPNTTEAEIKEYGSGKMHTLGAVTVTYFYPADTPNIPNDIVTFADSALWAIGINNLDGRFTFQGLINPQGEYIFTEVKKAREGASP